MGFRITTWNVNGIRNPFGYQPWREKRTFQTMFDILEADIVIIQETKIQRKDLSDDMVLVPGWDVYFSLPRHKKGYSGVAIYTRNATCAPIRAEEGITGVLCPPKSTTQFRHLPRDQQIGGYPHPGQLSGNIDQLLLDCEGRCVVLEFPAFVLLGVYSPANRDESRAAFRMEFLEALDVRIRNLVAEGKQVILTGDLNVSRSELDSTNVAEALRKEGVGMDEWINMPSRRLFNHLVFGGQVTGARDSGREEPVLWDLCREFHPTREGMNTCWDTKRNTRPANNGSRIDYVLCSDGLKDWFTQANIQEGLMGSDHCPVFATVADVVTVGDSDVSLLDVVNPPDMFRDGRRIRAWSPRDVLPLSARLIPEFDRRQSIRDMLTRKPGPGVSSQASRGQASRGPSPSGDKATTGTESDTEAKANTDATSGVAVSGAVDAPSPYKRLAGFGDPAGPSSKRSKASGESNSSKVAKNQQTLQGFFRPVAAASSSNGDRAAWNDSTPDLGATQTTQKPEPMSRPLSRSLSSPSSTPSLANTPSATGARDWPSSSPHPAQLQIHDRVFDPIRAKESWSKLLGKRVLPRCEHSEPCISLVTKKPGVNCGRSFYICPRPLGPSGEKETGSEWQCGTFIWSSDWNGSAS